ncbi:MAG: hypothetical protein FWG83_00125 [Oscillospiraceae bacterium]|nr:hypothetical protein [Oscillospiraceae bacterium]
MNKPIKSPGRHLVRVSSVLLLFQSIIIMWSGVVIATVGSAFSFLLSMLTLFTIEFPAMSAAFAVVGMFVVLIGVYSLVVAIMGLVYGNTPNKSNRLVILSGILLGLTATIVIFSLLSLILFSAAPLLYLIGAKKNEKFHMTQ